MIDTTVTECDILAGADEYLSKPQRFAKGAWGIVRRGKLMGEGFGASIHSAREFVKKHPNVDPCCCAEGACLLVGARLNAPARVVAAAIKSLDAEAKETHKAPHVTRVMTVNDSMGRAAVRRIFKAVRGKKCA